MVIADDGLEDAVADNKVVPELLDSEVTVVVD